MDQNQTHGMREIDIFDAWTILWSSKWLIVSVTAAFAVFSIVYALSRTDIFRAQAVLVPVQDQQRSGGLSSLADQVAGLNSLGISLHGSANTTEEALAILRSRAFTEKFIKQHDLLKYLFPDQWDDAKGAWTVEAPDQKPTLWEGFKKLNAARSVQYDQASRLVTVAIEWPDPELAADWVNGMVADLNQFAQQRAVDEAQRNRQFLERQLTSTSVVEMQQVLYDLMEDEVKVLMLAYGRPEYVFRTVEPALAPEEKVKPARAVICIAITILGGLLAVVVAFLRHGYRTHRQRVSTA